MTKLPFSHINNTRQILAAATDLKEKELQQYDNELVLPSSDEENEFDYSIYDYFYESRRAQDIWKMTNVSSKYMNQTFLSLESFLIQ